MKFSSRQDIETPIDEVFGVLSDFESVERSAIRRGIEIRRGSDSAAPSEGMTWDATFLIRGRTRTVGICLERLDPPNGMTFAITSPSISGGMKVELVALSPRRTRMLVAVELKPTTLTGRLFIQSMKLTKKKLDRQFKRRVADYARMVEERFTRLA